MNRVIVHSFFYVLKVWFTAAGIAVAFVLLTYAIYKTGQLKRAADIGVLFSLGMMFLFHTLIICSLMVLIVRYITISNWNNFLNRLIVSLCWYGVTIVSVLVLPRLVFSTNDILSFLRIPFSTSDQVDRAFNLFIATLAVWPLASVICAWCYKIKPDPIGDSIVE